MRSLVPLFIYTRFICSYNSKITLNETFISEGKGCKGLVVE